MPIVGTMSWGFGKNGRSPFGNPFLQHLDEYVRQCNRIGVTSQWRREVFDNEKQDLPARPHGYYWEFRVVEPTNKYRMVLGNGGEVFVTWDHYNNFYQVFRVPGVYPIIRPPIP